MSRKPRSHRATFEVERETRFLNFMGLSYPYQPPTPRREAKPDPDKIFVLADIHEPYSDRRAIEAAEQHKDAKTLIIPGDIGDFYSKSRFRKTRYVSFKEELRAVFARLAWASANFTEVKVMLGNHDNRPEKMILGRMDNGAVDLLTLTEYDLLAHLASYFDNVKMVGTSVGVDGIRATHIYQHGDIVFTHAELSRAQSSAILERISIYLHRWSRRLNLKPYRVIAQAHNHRAMKSTEDGETWFVLPCAMDPYSIGAEYIYGSRMVGNPPQVGYSVFYQHNGVTDINRSNYFVL
jgi:predicted phosphodiesterase